MAKPYTPMDWYWRADDGRVFASARAAIVAEDDPGYRAFRDTDTRATVWPRDDDGAQTEAALDAVLAPYGLSTRPRAPEPEAPTLLPFLAFLALFTPEEQAAIVASEDPAVRLFCLMAAGASAVDLGDPRTETGTRRLEALKLIGKGRAADVLAGRDSPAAGTTE